MGPAIKLIVADSEAPSGDDRQYDVIGEDAHASPQPSRWHQQAYARSFVG
ncbi:MAG: hypothetical protein N0A16_12135 [Blastocatellia bacterium]|nr:hypothetical protein [Blastocatellia bacterium]